MLKLLKYLKKSAGTIAFIVVLLFLQAFCDLSLPGYTSNIVNIGIQQNGIENAVPEKIRASEMDKLLIFMNDTEKELVLDSFILNSEEDIFYRDKISQEINEQLNDIFGRPMLIVSGLSDESEQADQMKQQMGLPKEADLFEVFAQMPQEQIEEVKGHIGEAIDELPETIITQGAISYVKGEYTAQGINMNSYQNNYILRAGAKMLALALLGMIVAISVVLLSTRVAASLSHDLRDNVYKKVISFSSAEFDQFSTASLITRSTNDIQQVQIFMTMVFRIVLYAPILGIGGVLKVLKTNTSMAWIIVVAVLAIMTLVGVLFSVAMPRFKKLQTLIDRLNLVTREILTGIPVIRAFSTQKHEEERFEDANHTLMRTNLFVNRCMAFMMPTMVLIMNSITILIVYRGAYGVDAGQMQVGDLMAFIQYTMQIIMAFLMISMLSIMLPRASVSASRITEVLDKEVMIKDPEQAKTFADTKKGVLEFQNVSFAYPDAEEEVLSDVSFIAETGKTTAFIGSTGSGKSTLINLIPRFFDVTKGKITIDGIDIRDVSQHELRDKIGYVPQKGILFSGTIDSNLRYGKEDASQEEIERAAKIAQAFDFIQEKDETFDSAIAQGGSNVSGGQKQRLSIARAIAKNPDIYIFDDSFSALDYKTDVVLRRALKNETSDAITLIVAQRISTILHADQIIVLDDGKIVGHGTHKELLKSCEVYQQIATSQLSEAELADSKEGSGNEQ